MFVGESGIARVVQRTSEMMRAHKVEAPDQVRALGVIDLETIQRYLNFHYSVTLDLFGADRSSNAAAFYSNGLKGRYEETTIADDHVLKDATYPILEVQNGQLVETQAPALVALNERLRDEFIKDSIRGVSRWNKVLEKHGVKYRLQVPHRAFNRRIGSFAGARVSPEGRIITETEWAAQVSQWLPTAEDRAFVTSLMGRVIEPGQFANWIAPPTLGIKGKPVDFAYVRFN
jgi:benzoyl-CoA 2,3-dioxygenase component B